MMPAPWCGTKLPTGANRLRWRTRYKEERISSKDLRVNTQIRITPVRLIGADGEQLGIVPTSEALARARESGLDLVEVSPTSRPPVCRILDFGKLKYEESKKDKVAKKKQHTFQLKEMRYRPKIDDHDFDFKTKHVREFLLSGSKVKVFVMFRGRELAYTEFGSRILNQVREELADVAITDQEPKLDGKNMIMVLAPNAEVIRKLKEAKPTPKAERRESDETDDTQTVAPAAVSQEKK